MHEDIDDFEPDWDAYNRMDSEDKKLLRELESWERKFYIHGKISHDKYMEGLKGFYKILSLRQMKEVDEYEKEKLRLKSIENKKKNQEDLQKKIAKEEFNSKIGCYLGIIIIIVFILGAIS